MGDFNYVEPAQVKVLVVPVGRIGLQFHSHLQALKTATNIRLVDVSPIPGTHFNPQLNSHGKMFLLFSTDPVPDDTLALGDLEPFRRTLIVLGVALHSDFSPDITAELRERYLSAVSHNCVFFDAPSSTSPAQDCFFVTEEAQHVITSVETVLCGVTHNFLEELHNYVSSYESITLRSPASIDSSTLTRSILQAQKGLSMSLKASYSHTQSASSSLQDYKIKSSQKQSGRHAKFLGNFYLLAGCPADALQYFTDAAINTKKCDDYLWLASALEGLSVAVLVLLYLGHPVPSTNPMLLSVLQTGKTKTYPFSGSLSRSSSESVAPVPAGAVHSPRSSISSASGTPANSGTVDTPKGAPLEFVLLLCLRAPHFYQLSTAELDDCVPDVVYIEALLRSLDFMQTAYSVGGDDLGRVVKRILDGEPIPAAPLGGPSPVSKETILHEAHRVFSLEISKLRFSQIARVYVKIISVYRTLGLHRKQGFVLRQLLVAFQSQLVVDAEKEPDAEIKRTIDSIVHLILGIYHVCDSPASGQSSTWSTLQLRILRACLDIAETIQDHEMAAQLSVLLLHSYTHCLTRDDQLRLKQKLDCFAQHMHSDNCATIIPYPDPFLIRDVCFYGDPRELLAPLQMGPRKKEEPVFDPYAKTVPSGIDMARVVCVNEFHAVRMELQNPFYFDVSVRSIEAVTENGMRVEISDDHSRVVGSDFKADIRPARASYWRDAAPGASTLLLFNNGTKDPLVVPAQAKTTVEFQMRALQVGELVIDRFRVAVDHFGPQEFCVVEQETYPAAGKVKYVGGGAEHGARTLEHVIEALSRCGAHARLHSRVFLLTVIPTQPQLLLVDNLVRNGWVMLLEGERRQCYIDVCNTSAVTIDTLAFAPWDTSLDAISAALAAKDPAMDAEDVHELEWQLLKRKALTITNKNEIVSNHFKIAPGEQMRIAFELFGKHAVKDVRFVLEYGMKNDVGAVGDAGDVSSSFVKTLTVSYKVTVYRSIEVVACHVMPFLPTSLDELSLRSGQNKVRKHFEDLLQFLSRLKDSEAVNYCLLVLDMCNRWRERLHVDLRVQVAADASFSVHETVDPEHVLRVLMPVRRAEHALEHYMRPIPSLKNKQFVRSDLPEEQQAQGRLSYWLRDELLEKLSGECKTVSSGPCRSADIDMRRIRLTPALVAALVPDSVVVQHEILCDDTAGPVAKTRDNYFELACGTFYTMKTHITNRSAAPIRAMLSYIPIPVHAATKQDLTIESKIFYNGVLQRPIAPDAVPPGESVTVKLGFMVLERGLYEWGSVLSQGARAAASIDREPLYIRAT